jgi:SsrA-binding protein
MSIVTNKKATLNYEVLDKYEGGLELHGFEVKAIRMGRIKFDGSYIIINNDEVFLKNAEIAPYQPNNIPKDFQPNRLIKILISKKEILKLKQKTEKEGLTLIPLSIFNKNKKLKIDFALAKGKKKHDKRQDIKRREDTIEILRTIKGER